MNTDTTNNEFTFTEDEIVAAVHDPRYWVKNMLVNQLKQANNMKSMVENLDLEDASPLQWRMIDDILGGEYNVFRMCCPKAWKAFMDLLEKRKMEYLECEKKYKALKAKLPWYKRIFA